MNKPEGDITLEEAQTVTKLDLSNAGFDDMNSKNGGIRDITDLKYFKNLEELNLSYNNIKDFTPLSELTSLTNLGFNGVRPDDLSPLKSLTKQWCA
jgi:Leucine-rich repeat (LRR) protein